MKRGARAKSLSKI